MHGISFARLLLLGAALQAASASALPLTASVDPSASSIEFSITDPFPGGPQTASPAGDVSGDVILDVGVPVQLQADGGALAFSDLTFVLDTPAGTSLTLQSQGLGGSLSGPATPGFANSASSALYDFGGWTLTLDTGTLIGTGSQFGQPIDLLLDLATSPLDFVYPLNSIGLATATNLGGGLFEVGVVFPFDLDTTVLIDQVAMDFSIRGQLVVAGQTLVPEPGTGLLVVAGLLPLALRRRRPSSWTGVAALGLLLLAAALAPLGSARAATFTVNSTGDAGDADPADTVCDTVLGPPLVCTLRAAIRQANADAATDTIAFDLPGVGPHTIVVSGSLPEISEPVVIDGYSQPGASRNTLAEGNDALLLVVVDGQGVGTNGIYLNAPSSELRGLVVRNFLDAGITVEPGATNCIIDGNRIEGNDTGIRVWFPADDCRIGGPYRADRNVVGGNATAGIEDVARRAVIQNNYVGTTPQGTVANPNGSGVVVGGFDAFVVGNLISGNSGDGLVMRGARSVAEGNLIGTDPTGTSKLGNFNDGVLLESFGMRVGGPSAAQRNVIGGSGAMGIELTLSSSDNDVQNNRIGIGSDGSPIPNFLPILDSGSGNRIGGIAPAGQIPGSLGNVIARNSNGIQILGSQSSILSNSIHDNFSAGLFGPGGIDLGGDGVTNNDLGDTDIGANDLQNFPELLDATRGLETRVVGRLDSHASETYTLQFFANDVCEASGHGQGQYFLGTAQVTTDASGRADFDVVLPRGAPGPDLAATATDGGGNTSEFSRCLFTGAVGADLDVRKSAVPLDAAAGDAVVFTIRVDNRGPAVPSGVQISDVLPPGLVYVSDSPSLGSYDETTGVWDVGMLGVGVPQFLDIEAMVLDDTPAGLSTNFAELISSSEPDPNGSNDLASATLTIRRGADLRVTQTVDDPGPDIGDRVTVTVAIENLGPRDATGVEIRGIVPADLALVSGLPVTDSGDGFAVTALGWVWQVGDLADGAVAQLELELDVVGGSFSTIQRAYVAASTEEDTVFANNLHSLAIGIGGAVDLSISLLSLTHGNVVVDAGVSRRQSDVLFEVRNLGPDEHPERATLVVSLNFDPFVGPAEPEFDVRGPNSVPLVCALTDARTMTCPMSLDLAPVGDSLNVRVSVVPAGSPQQAVVTATIASDFVFDPDPGNQSASTGISELLECFIATAAYGSPLDAHLDTLRDFRDDVLLDSRLGRAFVALYYEKSPPLAAFIARHDALRTATRAVLTPVVYGLRYPGTAAGAGVLLTLAWVTCARRRRA